MIVILSKIVGGGRWRFGAIFNWKSKLYSALNRSLKNLPKMPRGRKRKEEEKSESGENKAASGAKTLSDEKSPAKKRTDYDKSLTFKIEHW